MSSSSNTNNTSIQKGREPGWDLWRRGEGGLRSFHSSKKEAKSVQAFPFPKSINSKLGKGHISFVKIIFPKEVFMFCRLTDIRKVFQFMSAVCKEIININKKPVSILFNITAKHVGLLPSPFNHSILCCEIV